jgi:hypothetical protein
VDWESESDRPVALRAVKDGRILTWDAHPIMAEAAKHYLELAGWSVSISTDVGPRRREYPRIERRPDWPVGQALSDEQREPDRSVDYPIPKQASGG